MYSGIDLLLGCLLHCQLPIEHVPLMNDISGETLLYAIFCLFLGVLPFIEVQGLHLALPICHDSLQKHLSEEVADLVHHKAMMLALSLSQYKPSYSRQVRDTKAAQ